MEMDFLFIYAIRFYWALSYVRCYVRCWDVIMNMKGEVSALLELTEGDRQWIPKYHKGNWLCAYIQREVQGSLGTNKKGIYPSVESGEWVGEGASEDQTFELRPGRWVDLSQAKRRDQKMPGSRNGMGVRQERYAFTQQIPAHHSVVSLKRR